MRAIANVSPHALLFGTDLPYTRASRPFTPADLGSFTTSSASARCALYDNARAHLRS